MKARVLLVGLAFVLVICMPQTAHAMRMDEGGTGAHIGTVYGFGNPYIRAGFTSAQLSATIGPNPTAGGGGIPR